MSDKKEGVLRILDKYKREFSDRELYEKSGVNCFNYRIIQNILIF